MWCTYKRLAPEARYIATRDGFRWRARLGQKVIEEVLERHGSNGTAVGLHRNIAEDGRHR